MSVDMKKSLPIQTAYGLVHISVLQPNSECDGRVGDVGHVCLNPYTFICLLECDRTAISQQADILDVLPIDSLNGEGCPIPSYDESVECLVSLTRIAYISFPINFISSGFINRFPVGLQPSSYGTQDFLLIVGYSTVTFGGYIETQVSIS